MGGRVCKNWWRLWVLPANERGHYPITPMGVEIVLWEGEYQNVELPWLSWWDLYTNLVAHTRNQHYLALSI